MFLEILRHSTELRANLILLSVVTFRLQNSNVREQ